MVHKARAELQRDVQLFRKELILAGYDVVEGEPVRWRQEIFKKLLKVKRAGRDHEVVIAIAGGQYNVYISPWNTRADGPFPDRFFETFDEAADYLMEILRNG